MRVRLKGINTVKKKLKDGSTAVYHYNRATGDRLEGQPGSPEFIASYAKSERATDRTKGILLQLMREYTCSTEFAKLAASTQSEYRRLLKAAETEFGQMPISALADPRVKSDFLDWRDIISKTSGEREADNRLTAISAMLTWASDVRGKIPSNHLKGFKRLYHSDRQDIIWLPSHVKAFMAAASVEMQQAMVLGLHSGQREGDLRRLAWPAYVGGSLWVRPQKETRNGKKGPLRPIKCTKTLKYMLDGMKRVSPVILTTSTGRPFTKRYFNKMWSDTMTKAGLETVLIPGIDGPVRLHFNDLRGTTVTLLAEAGSTIPEIASITGHSLETVHNILKRYLKLTKGLAEAAILKFENSKNTKFATGLRVKRKTR